MGYDWHTRLRVGCIGRNGFRAGQLPIEEQFPVDGRKWRHPQYVMYGRSNNACIQGEGSFYDEMFTAKKLQEMGIIPPWAIYLLTDDGLVQIDMKKRTVRLLLKEKNMVPMAESREPPLTADAPDDRRSTIVVRTRNRVVVLKPDGKELRAYPLPDELRGLDLRWFALSGGKALVDNAAGRERSVLDRYHPARSSGDESVDLEPPSFAEPYSSETHHDSPIPRRAGTTGVAVVAGAFAKPLGRWRGLTCSPRAYQHRSGRGSVSVGSGSMGFHGPAFGSGSCWLFGLPAYFGYLAHRRWPARLPCPHCGRPVPRDRPACFACGHDFPPPALKGIEVFA